MGRPSIPPEQLLRALLLQSLHTIRSERPLQGDIAAAFFGAVVDQARQAGLLSDEVNFHGESRRNDTHQSTTDPDARLARKGHGKEAKLSYAGHVLLDTRRGLAANVCVTAATGTAEREAALLLLGEVPDAATVGGDKGFDVATFVEQVRALDVTPHMAQKDKYTAIDGRTTRHPPASRVMPIPPRRGDDRRTHTEIENMVTRGTLSSAGSMVRNLGSSSLCWRDPSIFVCEIL